MNTGERLHVWDMIEPNRYIETLFEAHNNINMTQRIPLRYCFPRGGFIDNTLIHLEHLGEDGVPY